MSVIGPDQSKVKRLRLCDEKLEDRRGGVLR
jgi:hypothetical protein